MAEERPSRPAGPPRERAYLALMLLVGAGALGTGAFEAVLLRGLPLPVLVDLALGAGVLLVTGLLRLPSAERSIRPGAGAARSARGTADAPDARRGGAADAEGAARSPPPPAIPRWADPMVHPRIGATARPASAHAAAPSTRPARPVRSSPAPSGAPRPLPRLREEELFPLDAPDEALPLDLTGTPDEQLGAGPPVRASEVLDELDRIEAELRTFAAAPGTHPPTPPVLSEDPAGA